MTATPVRRLIEAVGAQNLSLIAAVVTVLAIFGSLNAEYLGWSNLRFIGQAITIMGLLAVMETVVIIAGGIDISVGSQVGLAAVIGSTVFTATGGPAGSAGAAIIAAVVAGAACGALNGVIIIYFRVNPIIATLAMLAAYKGLAQVISGGRAIGYVLGDDVFIFVSRGTILGLPTMVWLLIIVAAAVHVLLKYTDIGRNIYAIGGNATAARLAGIKINKYLISAYVLVGIVAAVAGLVLLSRSGSGQPTAGSEGLELKAITAAFLGGCAMRGGRGSVGGALLAVVLLGSLENGLTVTGVSTFWQNIAIGSLLVMAVALQQRREGQRAVGLPD